MSDVIPTQPRSWSGQRALVTGGEGFIGSNLVRALLAAGADVRVLAHYKPYGSKGHLADLAGEIEVVAGDVRDAGLVYGAVSGCETVFHLAALIGIPYSYLAPESYVQTNVVGSQNVAEACRRADVIQLVHTSTSEVYGTALTVPIEERHPLQPQSPYSASKIAADMMMLSYWHAFGLPVSVVRPFNVFGPGQSTRAVIPTLLSQLLAGRTEIKLGALTPTRDFTYVEDTAAGFMVVSSTPDSVGSVTNIGSGREISIGELAAMAMDITGQRAVIRVEAERLRPQRSEVDRLLCDNARARRLGWEPTVTLQDGLQRTADWISDHIEHLDTVAYQR